MATLSEYSQLADKGKYFTNGDTPIIVNVDKILEKLEEFEATGDFIFRGCSEAKYKIYNSAQRHYIINELFKHVPSNDISNHYNSFITELIEECKFWNNATVKNLLIQNKVHEENSLAYLSYMQHYGVPSPFLDFTFDPYIALFFAIEDVSYYPSNVEIDNFFSVYSTYQNATIFEGWQGVFNQKTPNLKEGKIPYADVNKHSMHILLPDNEAYQIINNSNIINQKGLFFYSNHPFKPIEETYYDFALEIKSQLGEQKFKDLLMHEQFANCFNIHKSLIPYLKDILKSKGITKEFIYPDSYKMKNDVVHYATKKILTTKK
jgi:hypothetical protein